MFIGREESKSNPEELSPMVLLEYHLTKKACLTALLEILKQKGYKAFLFEKNDGFTLEQFIKSCKQVIEKRNEISKDDRAILESLARNASELRAIASLFTEDPYHLLPDEDPVMFVDERWMERIKMLPDAEQVKTAKIFNTACAIRFAVISLQFLEKIKSLGFEYHEIDDHSIVDEDKIYGEGTEHKHQQQRNNYMSDQMIKLAAKYHGGVVCLIGAFHYAIQKLLQESKWKFGPKSHWVLLNPGKVLVYDPLSGDKFHLPQDSTELISQCPYSLNIIDAAADIGTFLKIVKMEPASESKPSYESLKNALLEGLWSYHEAYRKEDKAATIDLSKVFSRVHYGHDGRCRAINSIIFIESLDNDKSPEIVKYNKLLFLAYALMESGKKTKTKEHIESKLDEIHIDTLGLGSFLKENLKDADTQAKAFRKRLQLEPPRSIYQEIAEVERQGKGASDLCSRIKEKSQESAEYNLELTLIPKGSEQKRQSKGRTAL